MVTTTTATRSQSTTHEELYQDRLDLAWQIAAARWTPAGRWTLPPMGPFRRELLRQHGILIPSQSDPARHYAVTPHACTCPDATRGIAAHKLAGWCKHRIALWLVGQGYA